MRHVRLTPCATLDLAPGTPGVGVPVQLVIGRLYRVSCDSPILIRSTSGSPRLTDLRIDPSDAHCFIADVRQCVVAAALDAETHAWFQEEDPR